MAMVFNLGRLDAAGPRPSPAAADRRSLVLIGDFSVARPAQARDSDTLASLAASRPVLLDVDTLDTVVASFGGTLRLEWPAEDGMTALDVPLRTLDDLHPDALLDALPVFHPLTDLRRRLSDPREFAAAAAEVRGWRGAAEAPAPAVGPDPTAQDDIGWLLGRPGRAGTTVSEGLLDPLLRRIVAPHVLPAASPDAPALIAAVDRVLGETLRRVLHHPAFQRVEAAWRGLAFMTRRVETDPSLQMQVLDLAPEALAADLCASDDLSHSGLYRVLVEQPALDDHRPVPAAVIAWHAFGTTADDAALLGRIAQVAAHARVPFIAGLRPDAPAAEGDAARSPADASAWSALRALPQAAHLALAAPRFLLRPPYGRRNDPIERADFEELDGVADGARLPWGTASLAAGVLLAQHLLTQGADEAPGEPLSLDDLPAALAVDGDGETVTLPVTEQVLDERGAQALHALGAVPVLARRGRLELRWGGWHALSGEALAGPWSG